MAKVGSDRRISEFTGEVAFGFSQGAKNLDVGGREFNDTVDAGVGQVFNGLGEMGINAGELLGLGGKNASTGAGLVPVITNGAVEFVGNRWGGAAEKISGTTLTLIPALVAAPTPFTAAAAALIMVGCIAQEVGKNVRMHRDAARKGLEVDRNIREITDMCLGTGPGMFPDVSSYLCARAWLRCRLWESTTWFAGTAGLYIPGSRTEVKICTYTNEDERSAVYGEYDGGPTGALSACLNNHGGSRFFDGSPSAKGVNYALHRRATATKGSMLEHHEQILALKDLLVQTTQSSGVSGDSGQNLQALRLGLLVSWLARLIPMEVQSIKQRNQPGQSEVYVSYDVFWHNFQHIVGLSPEAAVRPAEILFGAVEGSFDDGALIEYFQNFGEGVYVDPSLVDGTGGSGDGWGFPGRGSDNGGGGGAVLAALAGAALLYTSVK